MASQAEERAKEVKEALFRQRRNLITISAIILVIASANVTFTGDFSHQGIGMKAGSPEHLFSAILFLWWYWLYRYYVYFNKSILIFKDVYHERILSVIRDRISEIVRFDPRIDEEIKRQEKKNNTTFSKATNANVVKYFYNEKNGNFEIDINSLNLFYNHIDSEHEDVLTPGDLILEIPKDSFAKYEREANVSAHLRDPFNTEYRFPFILSAMVIVVLYYKVFGYLGLV